MRDGDTFLRDQARITFGQGHLETAKSFAKIAGKEWGKDPQARAEENPFDERHEAQLRGAWLDGFRETATGAHAVRGGGNAAARSVPPGDRD